MKKVFVVIMFAAVMSCQNAPEKDKYLNANDPTSIPYLVSASTPPGPVDRSNPGTGKMGQATVVLNNKVWVIGGAQYDYFSSNLTEVWSSGDGMTWRLETKTPGWTSRFGHTCVVDNNNRIWLMGGGNGSTVYNEIWYSDNGINWTKWPSPANWSARKFHASVFFNNKIWVIGGVGSSMNYSKEVWSMDPLTGAWTLETSTPPSWEAREGLSCVVFNNKLWIMGGLTKIPSGGGYTSNTYNDVWYSTDVNTWTSTPAFASWSGRYNHSSVMFNNSIWVIRGYFTENSSTKCANDVWSSSGAGATLTWSVLAPYSASVPAY